MKQKWTALVLALVLTASLAACGGQADNSAAPDESVQTQGDASVPAESTPADRPEEAQEPEETQKDASQGGEETPDEKPENKPASGPSGSSATASGAAESPKTVDLSAFYDSISGGENFPTMMALKDDTLDALYEGLNDLKPKQCLVYTPMISAVGAEIALVEVASSGDVQTVKDIFQNRIDYQLELGAFYPQTVETWKNSAKIVSNGNYVLLVCMGEGGCDDIVNAFDKLF